MLLEGMVRVKNNNTGLNYKFGGPVAFEQIVCFSFMVTVYQEGFLFVLLAYDFHVQSSCML